MHRAVTGAATLVPCVGIALSVVTAQAGVDLLVVSMVALVAVGAGWVVTIRLPSSAVGPALAWCSSAIVLISINDVLAASAYTSNPLPLASAARHFWVGAWPVNLAGLLILLLVFPDGMRSGRIWVAIPWVYAAGTTLMIVAMWDAQQTGGTVEGTSATWRTALSLVGILVVSACFIAAAVSMVKRYRAGDDRSRLQIRWLLAAGLVVMVLLAGGWAAEGLGASINAAYTPFLVAIVVLVPAAVWLAMVRHDLFDIDRLLSDGTALLVTLVASAAIFGGVVAVVSRSVGLASGWGAATAGFVTALVLLPLHRSVARVVGRLVDRDRFVAVAAVEGFASDVHAGRRQAEEIEAVLQEAQRDPDLRVALVRGNGWTDLAGQSVVEPAGFTVKTGGDTIARISLGWDSVRARRRLAELAKAAWVPLEVSRLRLVLKQALEDAEASRTRLVDAAATERKRLERELHDGAQQRIIATGMRLRSLQRGLSSTASAEVDTAIAELESTVAELRRLAHGVRPSRLDDGLRPALEGLLAASPIPVHLQVDCLPETDDTRTLTAFLVVSEAVTNALKHSRADHIAVRVGVQGDRLTVEVSDNGVGGIPASGLTAIRDRVASVGGGLRVHSPSGCGTTVSAVV